ncbi:hypothetical protein AYI70_g2364 [Smittium culicis]|uniref:Uncharacterized protein n=1 Tax=Smittium culicis TaxID=133412 RepID=A0A1R1Y8L3_9FUNG|nr:hypothetical protein AYI70_g2364 [Smittium culicis]
MRPKILLKNNRKTYSIAICITVLPSIYFLQFHTTHRMRLKPHFTHVTIRLGLILAPTSPNVLNSHFVPSSPSVTTIISATAYPSITT